LLQLRESILEAKLNLTYYIEEYGDDSDDDEDDDNGGVAASAVPLNTTHLDSEEEATAAFGAMEEEPLTTESLLALREGLISEI